MTEAVKNLIGICSRGVSNLRHTKENLFIGS